MPKLLIFVDLNRLRQACFETVFWKVLSSGETAALSARSAAPGH
jgi:hypothetical protein